jgi:hypothetical protein
MAPEASAGCVCLFSIASIIVFESRADGMSWGFYSANGAPYFAVPEGDKPGQCVFEMQLQGKTVMKALDVTVKTGGTKHAWVEESERIAVTNNLLLELVPAQANPDDAHQTVLCGNEVLSN